MDCVQEISPQIFWVGSGDRRLALFENLFPLENGVTYNSYVILDEKTALIDTVDASVTAQFLENLDAVLGDRPLDYLVINHMEPDHCANIGEILRRWPDAQIVGNPKTFPLIKQFYNLELDDKMVPVNEGDRLSLGKHNLQFIMAPMVHWPEVMFTYETSRDILFSADAFGTFGGYSGNLRSDETDYENLYLEETRRYYTNIVGKFGPQVLAVLKKLENATPKLICPLHGPVICGKAAESLLQKYTQWASYTPEKQGVVIAYASIYGNTENAMHKFAGLLSKNGVKDIRMYDVSKTHYSYIIAQAFKYSHLVFAATTYNMHLHLNMEMLLRDMAHLNLQNRDVAVIGNGSWAPTAHKNMQDLLETMKNMRILGEPFVIRSAMLPQQEQAFEALAAQMAASVKGL